MSRVVCHCQATGRGQSSQTRRGCGYTIGRRRVAVRVTAAGTPVVRAGRAMRFFRATPKLVTAEQPFGPETTTVKVLLARFNASPGLEAPRLLQAAAASGWDAARRDRLISETLREAQALGRLQDLAAIMRAVETAVDDAALGALGSLVSPAAASGTRMFLAKLGPERAQDLRRTVLKRGAWRLEATVPKEDQAIERLMAYFFVLHDVLLQAAITVALRPFMPSERFAELWSPFAQIWALA